MKKFKKKTKAEKWQVIAKVKSPQPLFRDIGMTFVLSGFDLATRISYFTTLVKVFTNYILGKNKFHESCKGSRTRTLLSLKPEKKYQIIWRCHSFKRIINDFQHYFLSTLNLMKLKMTNY